MPAKVKTAPKPRSRSPRKASMPVDIPKPTPPAAEPLPLGIIEVDSIVCHPACPQAGQARDAWLCECGCGRRAYVCGACLAAGRVRGCEACG